MASRNYRYYQPNEKDVKDKYGDCVVRSLVKGTDSTWLRVFNELISYAREFQCMPSEKICYETFLVNHGFTYTGISNKKGSKRPTVDRFTKDHKAGIYILVVANHLVCSRDGYYYDIWDSGECCMYGYWYKEA